MLQLALIFGSGIYCAIYIKPQVSKDKDKIRAPFTKIEHAARSHSSASRLTAKTFSNRPLPDRPREKRPRSQRSKSSAVADHTNQPEDHVKPVKPLKRNKSKDSAKSDVVPMKKIASLENVWKKPTAQLTYTHTTEENSMGLFSVMIGNPSHDMESSHVPYLPCKMSVITADDPRVNLDKLSRSKINKSRPSDHSSEKHTKLEKKSSTGVRQRSKRKVRSMTGSGPAITVSPSVANESDADTYRPGNATGKVGYNFGKFQSDSATNRHAVYNSTLAPRTIVISNSSDNASSFQNQSTRKTKRKVKKTAKL